MSFHYAQILDNTPKSQEGGFPLLAAVTMAEVFASADSRQAMGFYAAIGRRIASYVDLDGVSETAALVARMNQLWSTLGWGWAEIDLGQDGVVIHHHDMPQELYGDLDARWPEAAAAILEGAYDAWFRGLIADCTLQTEFVGWNLGTAELRHGR